MCVGVHGGKEVGSGVVYMHGKDIKLFCLCAFLIYLVIVVSLPDFDRLIGKHGGTIQDADICRDAGM